MLVSPRALRQGGVTLIELMIAIFVLAILATLAVPNFRDAMHRGQVRTATVALAGSFAYARAEAVTRGTFVSVCPSTTGDACTGSAAYESGWIVYTYPMGADGADQAYDKSKETFTLLRRVDAPAGVAVTAADKQVVTFGQQGQVLRRPAAGKAPVRLAVCAKGKDGRPASTSAVPGALMELEAGGGSHSRVLKVDEACKPA
jgi:type IV fimbrial biogenesis protein FimT